MVEIRFIVPGRAQPAGSKSAMPFKRKDGSLGVAVRDGKTKDSARRHSDWRALVSFAASKAMALQTPLDVPLELGLQVVFTRPTSHFNSKGLLNKKGRTTPFPASIPDWDKLSRSVSDALKGIVWTDDSRVCIAYVSKRWGERDETTIQVRPLPIP